MIEHINNYNVNTISHEKCLPVSIDKNKPHTITKKNTTCLLQLTITCDC